MTPEELRKWQDEQIAALIVCGIDPLDAATTVRRVLAKLPPNADPRIWIPTVEQLDDEPVDSEAALNDARANWYASDSVPAKFKRLLDATEEE